MTLPIPENDPDDVATIISCIGCDRRYLRENAADPNATDQPGCPFCGTPVKASDATGHMPEGDPRQFSFAGGVTATVYLSGASDLHDMVAQELRRATAAWRARLEHSDGHGGMLTAHHQQRVLDAYPEPLNFLLSDLIAMNEKYWLRSVRWDTYGAEQVREQGLTANQRTWAEAIREVFSADE